MMRLLGLLHTALVALGSAVKSPFLLAVRLYWGWQFAAQGLNKFGNTSAFVERFQGWGIPMPGLNVYLAGTTELVGGVLLFLGFFSRLACIPLMFTMMVAYFTAEIATVKGVFSDPEGLSHGLDAFVSAAPFLYFFAALIIFIFGPGFLSVDRIFRKNP